MKRWPSFISNLAGLALLLALVSCGGSAAPGGDGTGGVGVNQALPGMDEVPLGPKVDPNDTSNRVFLSCFKIPPVKQAGSSAGESGEGEFAAIDSYILKMYFHPPLGPRMMRVVDKVKGEYRQKLTSENKIFMKWETQSQPGAAFYSVDSPGAQTHLESKPCSDAACHDQGMHEFKPCLWDSSCSFYGWNERSCALPPE